MFSLKVFFPGYIDDDFIIYLFYCLFPTLGLGLQAEGLGLHCLLEATLVACVEPIYYHFCYLELTIFRTLAEPFLQIFVEKA